ncbi:MAG: hypothetical protein ACT4QC_22705 [Planctomycetaceae bacterium]
MIRRLAVLLVAVAAGCSRGPAKPVAEYEAAQRLFDAAAERSAKATVNRQAFRDPELRKRLGAPEWGPDDEKRDAELAAEEKSAQAELDRARRILDEAESHLRD